MAEPPALIIEQGYEPDDISVRSVVLVGAATLGVLALILAGLWGMVEVLAGKHRQPSAPLVEEMPVQPASPRLQAAPLQDLAASRAAEEQALHRWSWIDRDGGIAQIPIEQAMDELARRGWPQADRPAPPVPPRAGALPSAAGAPPSGRDAAAASSHGGQR